MATVTSLVGRAHQLVVGRLVASLADAVKEEVGADHLVGAGAVRPGAVLTVDTVASPVLRGSGNVTLGEGRVVVGQTGVDDTDHEALASGLDAAELLPEATLAAHAQEVRAHVGHRGGRSLGVVDVGLVQLLHLDRGDGLDVTTVGQFSSLGCGQLHREAVENGVVPVGRLRVDRGQNCVLGLSQLGGVGLGGTRGDVQLLACSRSRAGVGGQRCVVQQDDVLPVLEVSRADGRPGVVGRERRGCSGRGGEHAAHHPDTGYNREGALRQPCWCSMSHYYPLHCSGAPPTGAPGLT